jgi:hypothetical protein
MVAQNGDTGPACGTIGRKAKEFEMAVLTIDELYQQQIRSRPSQERLRLLELVAHDLANDSSSDRSRKRSLLELEGIGEHNPIGMDAQEYVNKLREEWSHRP